MAKKIPLSSCVPSQSLKVRTDMLGVNLSICKFQFGLKLAVSCSVIYNSKHTHAGGVIAHGSKVELDSDFVFRPFGIDDPNCACNHCSSLLVVQSKRGRQFDTW